MMQLMRRHMLMCFGEGCRGVFEAGWLARQLIVWLVKHNSMLVQAKLSLAELVWITKLSRSHISLNLAR